MTAVTAWTHTRMLEVGAENKQLRAQLKEAEELLRDLQWGSCDGCRGRGYCPECGEREGYYGALRGDDVEDENGFVTVGHAEDCAVGQYFAKHARKETKVSDA